MYKVLDLFSGWGGFSLGLERTGGFETVAFCEIEDFPRKVLAKNWPNLPIHDDVRKLDGKQYRGTVDVVCGGFPCQDLSVAGKQGGINANRSGLWSELCRIISEVRPRYAIVENVPNLLAGQRGAWFGRVLGDLAEIGYDCEWHCIPASAIGARHRRDRVWIICHTNNYGQPSAEIRNSTNEGSDCSKEGKKQTSKSTRSNLQCGIMANTKSQQSNVSQSIGEDGEPSTHEFGSEDRSNSVPNSSSQCGNDGKRGEHCQERQIQITPRRSGCNASIPNSKRIRLQGSWESKQPVYTTPIISRETIKSEHGCFKEIWKAEPDVGRVADGVPDAVEQLKGFGNAVVPQIPELIGRAILQAEAARSPRTPRDD